jgi:hypothetical protein
LGRVGVIAAVAALLVIVNIVLAYLAALVQGDPTAITITVIVLLAPAGWIGWRVTRWARQRRAAARAEEIRQRALDAYIERLRRADLPAIDTLDGVEFEWVLEMAFGELGYEVRTTRNSGDFGADLLLDMDGVRTVVQAKRQNQPVGVRAVQEVVASARHYGAEHMIVVTNNRFTPSAYKLAESNGLELWDRDRLADFLADVAEERRVARAEQPALLKVITGHQENPAS